MILLEKKAKKRARLTELFEAGREFLNDIKPDEKVVLIYHNDVDGTCAAALAVKAMRILGKRFYKRIPTDYIRIQKEVAKLQDADKIIILDVGTNEEFSSFLENPTLIIDHHSIKFDLNSEKIVFINPLFDDVETYQPATYLTYKFFSEVVDLKDSLWVAVIGIAADYAYQDCKDVVDQVIEVKDRDELQESKFGRAMRFLNGASYEVGVDDIVDFLLFVESIDEIEKDEKLKQAYSKYEDAFEDGKKQFWGNAETSGNVIFSAIKPKYERLGSPIVNEISKKNPDKIIFLFEDLGGIYDIDARFQSGKIHLGDLLNRVCGGGGHRKAAGGHIKKAELEAAKRKILEELKRVDASSG